MHGGCNRPAAVPESALTTPSSLQALKRGTPNRRQRPKEGGGGARPRGLRPLTPPGTPPFRYSRRQAVWHLRVRRQTRVCPAEGCQVRQGAFLVGARCSAVNYIADGELAARVPVRPSQSDSGRVGTRHSQQLTHHVDAPRPAARGAPVKSHRRPRSTSSHESGLHARLPSWPHPRFNVSHPPCRPIRRVSSRTAGRTTRLQHGCRMSLSAPVEGRKCSCNVILRTLVNVGPT